MDRNSMKRKASISHDEATIRRLRKNPDFAAEYLKSALQDQVGPAFCSLHCVISSKLGESRQNTIASVYWFSFMESLG